MSQNNILNIENLRKFEHKTFQTITKGIVLVKLNKFSGKIYLKTSPGLSFSVKPWVVQKGYSTLPQKLETPPTAAFTKGENGQQGPKIEFDTDYVYVISDPVKFAQMELSESQKNIPKATLDIIGERLDNIVRGYISTKKINEFIGQGNVDIVNECVYDLAQITKDYGITVTEMIITKIQLPKEISDQMTRNETSKLRIEEAENKRKENKILAESQKEMKEIDSKAEATKLSSIIEAALKVAKENGGNAQDMCRAIGQKLVNEGLVNGSNPNTTIFATNAVNYAYQQSATSNGNFDINAMIAILMSAMNQMNNSKNINNKNINNLDNSDILSNNSLENNYLSKEAEEALFEAGLAERKYAGHYVWENLSDKSIDYLKRQGLYPNEDNENVRKFR